MKRHLYVISLIVFFISFAYDLIVWGALSFLPEVGAPIVASARRESPLAASYIALGHVMDATSPLLQDFGGQTFIAALGDNFARIHDDPTAAMDVIFHASPDSALRWLTIMYWAAPFSLLVTLALWWLRPRQVNALGRHR